MPLSRPPLHLGRQSLSFPFGDSGNHAMKVILVTVAAAASDYSLVSLLRDVGEDMYGKFHFEGIAEVPDMDSAITELHVHILATRHLGIVTSYLKKSLRRYGLSGHAQISRLDHASSRA